MSTTEQMDPQENADLVRDANTLINGLELVTRRGGVVFFLAATVSFVALAAGLVPVANVTSTVALLALGAGLVATVARIALGPAPEPLPEGPEAAPEVAQVAEPPATGSAPATAENRVIPTK